MRKFIHEAFLLESKIAEELYHEYAESLPIIDYHCHLSPEAIATDKQFDSITDLWLAGDHYKWRALRTLGVAEHYITGDASDFEKFEKFAEHTPLMIRNPLYHWSHLELARYFNEYELLSGSNAKRIYEETTSLIKTPEFSTRSLLTQMKVEIVCTTEDPTDDLPFHDHMLAHPFSIYVSTAFRPDKAILIENETYNDYIDQLAEVSAMEIQTYDDLLEALANRIDFFHSKGCRLSDHGLNYLPYTPASAAEVSKIFKTRRSGGAITPEDAEKFQTALLLTLGQSYHKKGWVQQFHLGAMRNNNTRMLSTLGPDTGWDSIGTYPITASLSQYLNALDSTDQLTKTILYNLNPADNAVMATMIGNFNDGSVKGKVQWGSGWWFLDQLDGMTEQINTLSNMGILSSFVGMLTDSRSFLSYPRHEYFRRLICNLIGNDIVKGHLPHDLPWMGKIISDICYYNAKNYFPFKL